MTDSPDTKELIAQGRKLFEATTPGSLEFDGRRWVVMEQDVEIDEADWGPEGHRVFTFASQDDYRAYKYGDMAFIAWAHNNFSALADAAERLEAELQVLRAEKKAAEDYWRNFRESMNQSASSSPAPEWMKNVETF